MANMNDLTPGVWNVDASHSRVGFVARHLMISKTRGHFNSFSGVVTVPEDRLQTTLEATVDIASIDTADANRDGHLKTGDFFDADQYPTMTFKSTKVEPDGGDYKLTGDLTLHGVTKPVTFELEFDGVSQDPWGGTRAGFSASTDINRKDWGLEYNAVLETGGVLIGDKVKIELEIELIKA